MQHFSNNDDKFPLSKFELMLKTNSVYFFDSNEFEEIILFYVDSGKFSLAKKALQLGLEQHPDSVALKLIQVELLILDEKLEKAEKILDHLKEIEPSNEEVFIQQATIYSKRGEHRRAVDSLQTALLFADEDAEILSMIGMEYLFLEEFDTARLNFAKSLEVEYENYSSLYNVIYCFDMLKKHDEAIVYLNEYIEKDPYSEIAWHQLGRQYYIVFDYAKALHAFEYAILIDENFIGAHLEKAKTLEELGHYEEAITFYQKTMELDTETSFAYLRIGKCYEKLDRRNDAIDFYNKTVNEDPLLDKGWLALADIFIEHNNFHKALFYVNKALSIDEENHLYWHKFAEINLKLNLFEEAVRAYYKCIGLKDDRLEVFVALSDVLHFLGEYHEGIRVLLDAREKYKDESEISYRLAGLHMLVQKEKESVYFMEIGLKEDLEDLDMVLKLFPSLDQNEQINSLIRKFRTDQ